MGDQPRSAPATGFQKFLLDPKSSVKTYLSESLEKDKLHWQQNGPHAGNPNQPQQQGNWQQQQQQQQQYGNNGQQGYPGSSMNPPVSPFPQRPATAAGNHPFQSERPPLPQGPPAQQQQQYPNFHSPQSSSAGFPPAPHAPTPVHPEHQLSPQFGQHPQQTPAPQHNPYGAPPSAHYPPEPQHAQNPQHAQGPPPSQGPPPAQGLTHTQGPPPAQGPPHAQGPPPPQAPQHIQGPPPAGVPVPGLDASRSGPGLAPPPHDSQGAAPSAPKQYHRMIVEFETLRTVYFTAKIQPARGDLIPIAEKLKNLAREIWNLRYTKSSEFQFPDPAHEQIITTWKAQFDMWTDIHEDHCDPVYSKTAADLDAQNDYPKLAGLSLGSPAPTPVKKTVKKTTAAAPPAEGEEPAAAPVKKKVAVKKAVAADGESADVALVKKKVVKKVVKKAAAE